MENHTEAKTTIGFLDQRLQNLNGKIAKLTTERDLLMSVITLLKNEYAEPQTQDREPSPNPGSTRPTNPDTDISNLSVNFDGVVNLLDRLIRIGEAAEAKGKLLNLTKITEFIIATGESTASKMNLRTNVGHALRENPEVFTKVRPGTYKYVPTQNQDSTTAQDAEY